MFMIVNEMCGTTHSIPVTREKSKIKSSHALEKLALLSAAKEEAGSADEENE